MRLNTLRLALYLFRTSRTTASPVAAPSAECVTRLAPQPAACALFRTSRTAARRGGPATAAPSAECVIRLAPHPGACALLRTSRTAARRGGPAAAAPSAECVTRLAPQPAACALFRTSRTTARRGGPATAARFLFRLVPCALLAGAALAQVPKIGIVDYYGLRKVPQARIEKALGVRAGDSLPASKGELEERLEAVPGVVRANVEAVCCESGNAILFVGIEEKGAPHFNFRVPPQEDLKLPEEITSTYQGFLEALSEATRKGESREDTSRGYSLMADPACRTLQEKFLVHADRNYDLLEKVLRNSSDGEQRAVASFTLGYSLRRERVIPLLQYAMQDSEDAVRNNAMRALAAIADLAQRDPSLELKISPTWFIEMLNSILWTDRNKASLALARLTEKRDQVILDQLRERALPSLIEMARWKSLGHALPAYLLVGRIARVPEEEILQAWTRGERDKVIAKASLRK